MKKDIPFQLNRQERLSLNWTLSLLKRLNLVIQCRLVPKWALRIPRNNK
jgi:hypothetical protein